MRRQSPIRGVMVAAALVLAGTAVAVAPWPGLARTVADGELRYVAAASAARRRFGHCAATRWSRRAR